MPWNISGKIRSHFKINHAEVWLFHQGLGNRLGETPQEDWPRWSFREMGERSIPQQGNGDGDELVKWWVHSAVSAFLYGLVGREWIFWYLMYLMCFFLVLSPSEALEMIQFNGFWINLFSPPNWWGWEMIQLLPWYFSSWGCNSITIPMVTEETSASSKGLLKSFRRCRVNELESHPYYILILGSVCNVSSMF